MDQSSLSPSEWEYCSEPKAVPSPRVALPCGIMSPFDLCAEAAEYAARALRRKGTINNLVRGGWRCLSLPFLQSPWRQLGEARPSQEPPGLLCLVLPLEGKQYNIRDMLLLGVTVLVPTVLSGFTLGALLILALSVPAAYLQHLQNRGCCSLGCKAYKISRCSHGLSERTLLPESDKAG